MGILNHLVPSSLYESVQQEEHQQQLLPQTRQDENREAESVDAPGARNPNDKIKCLDGLRGIACFIVFNYHFFWPWTPLIMLGYGALPPMSRQAYDHQYAQLPIICLLYRGRPMVAIFFAISGYVVCRHILRSIQQRRLEAVYKSLASAVFRRAFRLYIPPTISMFLVATLAQVGVFKSEFAVYKGPDSVYINGTVGTYGFSSTRNVYASVLPGGLAGAMNPPTLSGNHSNTTHTPWDGFNGIHGAANLTHWVEYGGNWEEHPLIHPNLTTALSNFTAVYIEWANPFTFNPYHPRLDPHAYTMPMELRGSMILYTFLLGTAALKLSWRLGLATFFSMFALTMGRWEVATFLGGMVLSEIDVLCTFGPANELTKPGRKSLSPSRKPWWRILHISLIIFALYLLSYPDTNAAFTPGFRTLAAMTPKHYIYHERWRFWQSIGALILLPCILCSPLLRELLEEKVPQYLGKMSFSFYLMHGPVLHSLGFWIMPRLFDAFGIFCGLVIGWPLLLGVSLWLAGIWYRRIDLWSVGVGRRVERFMVSQ